MATVQTGIATSFIDFTRASNATVTDSDGKVKWAPHNLLTNSESFDAAAWGTTAGVTLTANNAVAPNGTTTADNYAATNTVNYKGQTGITVIATQYTQSCFAKRVNTDWVYMNISNSTDKGAWFNLATGVKGTEESGVTAAIQSVGSEWYLCSIAFTGIAGNAVAVLPRPRDGDGSTTTTVGGSVLLWGAALYRSDLAMQPNTSAYPMYNPTTPKNLLGYTEDFSSSPTPWANTRGSIIANSTTGPINGLQTADAFNQIAGSTGWAVLQQTSSVAAGRKVFSVYAKPNGKNYLIMQANLNGAGNALTWFNVSTGAAGTTNAAHTALTPVSLGNGWWRFAIALDTTAATWSFGVGLADADNSTTVTDVGGLYVWGAQLSDSASLDPYVPVYGAAVTSAAYYGPRRDFDPVTLACKGLLVEEQRSNALTYSADFTTNGFPTATNIVVLADNATSPDGTTNADKLTDNTTANVQHRLFRSYTFASATAHTISVYAKRDTHRWFRMSCYDGTTAFFANFDLLNNVPGNKHASATSSITPVGSGWYRCTMTVTVAAAAGNIELVMLDSDATIVPSTYTGTATSLWLYGLQLEANASFATSYIPTGAATATRNADVASVSTQAFPYSQSAGSVVINYNYIGGRSVPYPVALDNGSGLSVFAGIRQDANLFNTDQGSLAISPALNATGLNKVAFAQATNDRAVSANSNPANTSSSTNTPGLATTLSIGLLGNTPATYGITGHIRQITYIPRRLSNAELQSRST